jgi:MFS family permease
LPWTTIGITDEKLYFYGGKAYMIKMNIKKYYIYRIFEDLMPIYPLYLLMFENKGLSVVEISMLLAIWSIPSVLFEIPTGILADRWSRKNLIVLGGLLKALCYFTWMISDGFLMYAAGFILWGIGGALRSGSEEALLYDSLKTQGEEDRFDAVYGRGHFLSGVSNILAAVSGGLIGAKFGFQTALGLSVLSGLVTSGTALSMKEINLYKEQLASGKHKDEYLKGEFYKEQSFTEQRNREQKLNAHKREQQIKERKPKEETLKNAALFLLKNKEILLFSLLAVVVITTAGILDEYDQLVAKEFGLSIKLIGLWSAVRFILMALGSFWARRLRIIVEKISGRKDRMYSVGFLCITAAVFLILSGIVRQITVMILYGLYYLLMSSGEVLQEDYLQQKVGQEGRSTVHSLVSLVRNLYGILFYGVFGMAVSMSDLFLGLVWCGAYIILWTFIIGGSYTIWKKRRKRQSYESI